MISENDFLKELGVLAFVTRLKRVSDAMLHDGRRLYRSLGMDIEPNWFVIFKLLEHQGPFTVTEIADRIGFAHPSVISIVNRMIAAGYVEEARVSSDSRKRHLKLTQKAVESMPKFERVWIAGTAGLKKMLDDVDAVRFLSALEQRVTESGFMARALAEYEERGRIRIETFNRSETEIFANLNFDWIEQYFEIEDQDRKVLGNPQREIIDAGGEIFFAKIDDEYCGTVALINEGDSFELAKMAVADRFRGQGIGDELIVACLDHARAAGKRRVFLLSNTKLIPAINLYRKHGFVEIPLDPAVPYKRTNIMMERILETTE